VRNCCLGCGPKGRPGKEEILSEPEFFKLFMGRNLIVFGNELSYLLTDVELRDGKVYANVHRHSEGTGEFLLDQIGVSLSDFFQKYLEGQEWVSADFIRKP
jgi:hypothetical protein